MELPPPSPLPYEYNGGDKDKDSGKEGKKKSSPLRIPLPASEVHASEPQKNERILSLFEKLDKKEPTQAEAKTEAPKEEPPQQPVEAPVAKTTAEEAAPHHDLADLHTDLWEEFDNSHYSVAEPTKVERDQGAYPADVEESFNQPSSKAREASVPRAAEATEEEIDAAFGDIMHRADVGGKLAAAHEELRQNDNQKQPEHIGWDETHTIHLNAPESQSPSTRAESTEALEALYTAPAAELPENHPEATVEPPQPLGQFKDRIPQASDTSNPAVENRPVTPEPSTDDDPYRQRWQPAAARPRSVFGPASLVAPAVEAAALTAATSAGAVHAAEAGLAGAAAGGVVGGIAGYEAGKHAAAGEMSELKRATQQQEQQQAVLTNEQRLTHEQVERLTHTNQHLIAEQQKMTAEKAAGIPLTTAVASERVTAHNPDEKVVRSEWVDMVVDKHTGKLIEREGVNEFGDELRAEQRPEATPADPLAAALAAAQAAAQTSVDITGTTYDLPSASSANPLLGSGQIGVAHELNAGYEADANHRLPVPQNSLVTAITSPLLWAGVIVLIVAFLAAAFL